MVREVFEGSMLLGAVRQVGRSVLRPVRRAAQWLQQTNARIAVGLRGRGAPAPPPAPEQFDAIVSDSRVVRALSACVNAPFDAWEGARTRRFVDAVLALDLAVRVRLIGWALLVAVLTHTVVMAVLRVHVFQLGWTFRGVVAVAATILMWRPDVFAAAWRDRAHR